MKTLPNLILGMSLGLSIGAGIVCLIPHKFFSLPKTETKIKDNKLVTSQITEEDLFPNYNNEEFFSLQKKYDSLKTKYDILDTNCTYWIKRYVDCQGERTQSLIKEIHKVTKNPKQKIQKDPEEEELKKALNEELNK